MFGWFTKISDRALRCPVFGTQVYNSLSYRTLLINSYFKEWMIRVCLQQEEMMPVAEMQRYQLRLANPLEAAIRDCLWRDNYEALGHFVTSINSKPTIAATGVVVYPPAGTHFHDSIEERILPVHSSPMAITILPNADGQMLLITYLKRDVMDAYDLKSKFLYPDGSVSTTTLSKFILGEMEFINIAPEIWSMYGGAKQREIVRYFTMSLGTTEEEFYVPSQLLDLFVPRS